MKKVKQQQSYQGAYDALNKLQKNWLIEQVKKKIGYSISTFHRKLKNTTSMRPIEHEALQELINSAGNIHQFEKNLNP
jgi:methylphosphotriester-DNA--protein-cysteine methyltransferase